MTHKRHAVSYIFIIIYLKMLDVDRLSKDSNFTSFFFLALCKIIFQPFFKRLEFFCHSEQISIPPLLRVGQLDSNNNNIFWMAKLLYAWGQWIKSIFSTGMFPKKAKRNSHYRSREIHISLWIRLRATAFLSFLNNSVNLWNYVCYQISDFLPTPSSR